MDIEIELKFLVSADAQAIILPLLDQFIGAEQHSNISHSIKQLANTYYDSEDKILRLQDIGLRVRSADGVHEQTIKTAGKVIGGLHQRPEYNVALPSEYPDLSLFEPDIFPVDLPLKQLQSTLIPLFTTDFLRQKWQLSNADGSFELVFDQGEIRCAGATEAICEVELELLLGDSDWMFEFAQQLVEGFKAHNEAHDLPSDQRCYIRLGYLTKAARGYQLYNQQTIIEKPALGVVPLQQTDTLESAFVKTVEYGLSFMQHHEQCFVNEPSLSALRRFTEGAGLIRHAMWLYSSEVAPQDVANFRSEIKWILQSFDWVEHARQLQVLKSQRGIFRKKLDLNDPLSRLVDEESDKDPCLEEIILFFSKPRYIRLLLDVSQWLLKRSWHHSPLSERADGDYTLLQDQAGELLTNAWQSLLTALPKQETLTIDDYTFHHKQLKRSLYTGSSLGSLYNDQAREEFRMPWLDLSRGIDELKTLNLLKTLAQKLDSEPGQAINSWLECQIETLLLAMEQSRQSASKMRTYWTGT